MNTHTAAIADTAISAHPKPPLKPLHLKKEKTTAMPVAQTTICTCTKCWWRRSATYSDTEPFRALRYERCPRCGSPATSRFAPPLEQAFGHIRDALPAAVALAAGTLALQALHKLIGKNGD